MKLDKIICCMICLAILIMASIMKNNIIEEYRRRNFFNIYKSIPTITRTGLRLNILDNSNDSITVINGVKIP